MQLDELNWKKPLGVPATMSFVADLPSGKNVQVKNINLKGTNIKAKGTASLDGKTMNLLSLDLQPLIVGRTNANVQIIPAQQPSDPIKYAVSGVGFDMTGLKGNKDAADTPPDLKTREYTINVGKLYTSENGFIANMQGRAVQDQIGWQNIDLHGLADGAHKLDITLLPQDAKNDHYSLNIICDDFGKALKGMGLTDTVKGGAFEVKGESIADDPRTIEGTVKIGSFAVTGLPALAQLLNAASPFGFADLVRGESSFGHLAGKFKWHGAELELSKTRMSGSVFGINVNGKMNIDNGMASLYGTLVPFSFFNSIIDKIPLLGDMITGGEGQGVIAAAYTVKGPLSSPDISVNPVSLLTPSFIRNLFFCRWR